MKKRMIFGILGFLISAGASLGQEIPQSQVPSLVVNSFQQSFSKAYDIEWEMDGELYKVEFETGFPGKDHDVWYDKTGKLTRHKEEIAKSDLPRQVLDKIAEDFRGYRLDDIKKITEGDRVIYSLELKSFTRDWDVVFDQNGNVLSKVPD